MDTKGGSERRIVLGLMFGPMREEVRRMVLRGIFGPKREEVREG